MVKRLSMMALSMLFVINFICAEQVFGASALRSRVVRSDSVVSGTLAEGGGDTKAVIDKDKEQCSICCEKNDVYKDGVVLPCSHILHSSCMQSWLIQGEDSCPVCRKVFFRGTIVFTKDITAESDRLEFAMTDWIFMNLFRQIAEKRQCRGPIPGGCILRADDIKFNKWLAQVSEQQKKDA